MSLKGHNYASISLDNLALVFNSKQGPTMCKLKYTQITNATLYNNKQIIIETKKNITADDCLTDIRLFFNNSKEETKQQNQDSNMQIEKEKNISATLVYNQILKKSKLGKNGGESIATIQQVNLVVPRGKYTLDFYPLELRFHGITFDYTIKYQHISKGFFLLMPNDKEVVLILQLHSDHPIYQGQTVHKYIVLQIRKDIVQQISTRRHPEMLQKHPQLKELQDEYNSFLYQIMVDLFSGIANINMIHPGQNFKSKNGNSCIRANVKAQTGWLFMLKQSIIFIFKPVIYLKLQNIRLIQFARTVLPSKNFDIIISLKEIQKKVQFTGLQSQQLDRLLQYFKSKSVNVSVEKSNPVSQLEGEEDSKQEQQDQDYDGNQEGQQSQEHQDEHQRQDSQS